MNKLIAKLFLKIVIVALLIGCLFQMPIGYYQMVKIVVFIISIIHYNISNKEKDYLSAVMFIIFGITFNPLFPLYLHRVGWEVIDKIAITVVSIAILIEGKTFIEIDDEKIK